jgi:hypothetical protein
VSRLVFDDDGNAWTDQNALRAHLHATMDGVEFLDFVVRNLGFISVQMKGRAATVVMREHTASGPAVMALIYWLSDSDPRIVSISPQHNSRLHEVLGSAPVAITKITARIAGARSSTNDRFFRRERYVDSLSLEHPFAHLLRLWWNTKGLMTDERYAPVLMGFLQDRHTLFDCDPDNQRLTFARAGSGFGPIMRKLNRTCARLKVRVEDQHDCDFGKWQAPQYRACLRAGVPLLDDVDATCHWPGLSPMRAMYQRVLLPVMRGNRRSLLSASLMHNRSLRAHTV